MSERDAGRVRQEVKFDAHVGVRIQVRRHALGLSRRQLAVKLDCEEDHLAGLEDGRRRITGDLIALAYVLADLVLRPSAA